MPKKKKSIYDYAGKYYAKQYGISVLKDGKPKTVQELTIDIYNYEVDNKIKNGLYGF
jgi:hypothetical protein